MTPPIQPHTEAEEQGDSSHDIGLRRAELREQEGKPLMKHFGPMKVDKDVHPLANMLGVIDGRNDIRLRSLAGLVDIAAEKSDIAIKDVRRTEGKVGAALGLLEKAKDTLAEHGVEIARNGTALLGITKDVGALTKTAERIETQTKLDRGFTQAAVREIDANFARWKSDFEAQGLFEKAQTGEAIAEVGAKVISVEQHVAELKAEREKGMNEGKKEGAIEGAEVGKKEGFWKGAFWTGIVAIVPVAIGIVKIVAWLLQHAGVK